MDPHDVDRIAVPSLADALGRSTLVPRVVGDDWCRAPERDGAWITGAAVGSEEPLAILALEDSVLHRSMIAHGEDGVPWSETSRCRTIADGDVPPGVGRRYRSVA